MNVRYEPEQLVARIGSLGCTAILASEPSLREKPPINCWNLNS